MNRFNKFFFAISQIIRKPSLLNLVLEDNTVKQKYITKKYNLNKGLPSIDLLDLFPDFNYSINPYSYLGGTCIPTDIALLKALARRIDAKKYFEIGTWRGESVCNIASEVEECYTLNLSTEEMLQKGLSQEYADLHGYYIKESTKINRLYGNSLNFDFKPYCGNIDLVFIDGDHHYETVKSDTVNAFKLIKSENSIIVWHDYSSDTEDARYDVLAGILDACPKEKIKNLYHVSNTLCAIYINGNFPVKFSNIYEAPNKHFEINIRAVKN